MGMISSTFYLEVRARAVFGKRRLIFADLCENGWVCFQTWRLAGREVLAVEGMGLF